MSGRPIKYNHMFDIAFTIESEKDSEKISKEELVEAVEKRVDFLKNNMEEALEAFGYCDSYEVDKEEEKEEK